MLTKVLIVAKTRQGSRACVGGITFDGRSVRLIAADHEVNEQAGMEYGIGEVWEVELRPPEATVPPHVENMVVWSKRRLAPMTDPEQFIEHHMPPHAGGPDGLYEGLVQVGPTGALYVAERTGVPACSTVFWRPDWPLERADEGKRIRYRYVGPDDSRTLVFVGFQEPVEIIPAGTLVRVSLAHWWRPEQDNHTELRCYVQLSGWFMEPSAEAEASVGVSTRGPARARPGGEVTAEPPALANAAASEMESSAGAPPAPAQPGNRPSLADAQTLLKSVFGYDTFRPLQAEIIDNLLNRQDTLAVMPTGSGKSLCYQLPALLRDGLTVVVSPLISLMQDQVSQLLEVGVPAVFLNSTLDYGAYRANAEQVRNGQAKLLYTSPETLLRPETLVLLDHCQVDCLAIDEAHCISAWGHDFRPEYRQLLPVRQRYPEAVCVAFTATATPRVRQDIRQILSLDEDSEFIASFNRQNLYLAAEPRTDGLAQTLAFLRSHRGEPGIIYCSTRAGVKRLAEQLRAKGWQALPYHAGLDDATRHANQEDFARDRAPIIVATIAFGMGINKSNVRFVLHYNLPDSLEAYYQEIGRAGRDGLRADCLLLYSRADMQTVYRFIEAGAEAERPGRRARLQAMARYAETTDCRRARLLEYFDEQAGTDNCAFCDNCLAAARPDGEKVDATEAALQLLICAKLTGQVFGAAHLIEVLRGSRAEGVLRHHHDRLTVYGAGKERSSIAWRGLAEQFIRQGLLLQDMEHGSLQLTDRGRAVLAGERVLVAAEEVHGAAPARSQPAPASEYDPELFERLRTLRRTIADGENVPPYVVFSDRTLAEMATWFPASERSLLQVHGVGERKLARYGERFLATIRDYCAERGIVEKIRPVVPKQPGQTDEAAAAPARAERAQGRSAEVGERFVAGLPMTDLQALYGVKERTIVSHLYVYLRAGGRLPAERVLELSTVGPVERQRALAVMAEMGTAYLRPIYDALEGTVSFDELAILRLYYLCLQSEAV
jgi:ATP-dependent DNA helicase RecQ